MALIVGMRVESDNKKVESCFWNAMASIRFRLLCIFP